MKSCCVPQALSAPTVAEFEAAQPPQQVHHDWVDLPAGAYVMGTDAVEGFAGDGEGPARTVRIGAFAIARTAVTNAQFRAFVRATSYATEAEQAGASFVFYLQLAPERRAQVRQMSRELPWWVSVEGACWQRPAGPGTGIADCLDHPVVHITWNDATAYCAWAGVRLPTEAQWEYAARGGLDQQRYPWGNELAPGGEQRCNIWQGRFPSEPAPGWRPGTVAADSLPPNAWGLHHMAGNAWEWCQDWFSAEYHVETPADDPVQRRDTGRKSLRGGSFLCHESYCNRYRVAARGSNTPNSSASNLGFRVVAGPRAAAGLRYAGGP